MKELEFSFHFENSTVNEKPSKFVQFVLKVLITLVHFIRIQKVYYEPLLDLKNLAQVTKIFNTYTNRP